MTGRTLSLIGTWGFVVLVFLGPFLWALVAELLGCWGSTAFALMLWGPWALALLAGFVGFIGVVMDNHQYKKRQTDLARRDPGVQR